MKALKIHKEKGVPAATEKLPALGSDFFANPFKGFFPSTGGHAFLKAPVVDISEDDKEITVKAEVPGLSEKDLDISYLDGVLYLKGEKKEEKESKGKRSWHHESWHGSFSRGLPIGRNADWKKAQAKYKDGILNVTIPKNRNAGENRVKIEIQ